MRVGWDISHLEFTVTDYYYFGKLNMFLQRNGFVVEEVGDFNQLSSFDTIVFNYPEVAFNDIEIGNIRQWAEAGKNIIFAGYYKNEDGVGSNINKVTQHFGLRMKLEEPQDPTSEDPYFLNVKSRSGLEGVFPCSDIVEGGEALLTSAVGTTACKIDVGKGKIVLLGSCVFWDSFSLPLKQNSAITSCLLRGENF
ncbi:hypothetical protein [Coprothermobacter platensis]|uniref:hypothetical protein n=1 Tax=Coprothermobacter platensis TaxID=108819 RepID=UPI0003810846|nr:hypothetical protein [Coprothermobacter platensis]